MRKLGQEMTGTYISSLGIYAMLAGLSPLLVNNELGMLLLLVALVTGALRIVAGVERGGNILLAAAETLVIGLTVYGLIWGLLHTIIQQM